MNRPKKYKKKGVWSFSVDRDVRDRNISQRVEVELVMVELPDSVYLQYENQQFRDTDLQEQIVNIGSLPFPQLKIKSAVVS